MELFLRDNDLSEWIELDEGVSLKIAYPTPEQELKLTSKFGELRWLNPEDESGRTAKMIEYFALLIRFCVKDWKGIKNKKTGDEIKCKVNDSNEVDSHLWKSLISIPGIAEYWGGAIKEQIDFNETDKKKL